MTEVHITGGPDPDPEELAAIVAAVQVAMSPGGAAEPEPEPTSPRWRFSGRWWSRPVAARRDRPSWL